MANILYKWMVLKTEQKSSALHVRQSLIHHMEKKEGKGATDGEKGYIHAMANLRSWALKMKSRMAQKGVVLNLLEPGLIDTNLSRTNFSHFGIDWKTIIKPLEYAKEEMRKMI